MKPKQCESAREDGSRRKSSTRTLRKLAFGQVYLSLCGPGSHLGTFAPVTVACSTTWRLFENHGDYMQLQELCLNLCKLVFFSSSISMAIVLLCGRPGTTEASVPW